MFSSPCVFIHINMKNFKQLLPESSRKLPENETRPASKIKNILQSIFGPSVETPISPTYPTNKFGRSEPELQKKSKTTTGSTRFNRYDTASNVENPTFYRNNPPPPTGSGSY